MAGGESKMAYKELVLGCDDTSVKLMTEVRSFLDELGIRYAFMGVQSKDDHTFYPLIANKVAEAIIESDYSKEGILICGTGIGMSVTANKHPGIYAALVTNIYAAKRSRLSNNANVLCIGALTTTATLAKEFIKVWLDSEYKIGRSEQKLEEIRKIESEYFK